MRIGLGAGPKMIESASKGAILMYSKEAINDVCLASGMGVTSSGVLRPLGSPYCTRDLQMQRGVQLSRSIA